MVRATSDSARKNFVAELSDELVKGDLKDRASLEAACRDAGAVTATSTAVSSRQKKDTIDSVDLHGQMNLIDAARGANVGHYVFISASGNLLRRNGNPLLDAKRAVENHLRQSGLNYTILRPSSFMEIWLSPFLGLDFRNARATIYGSGENKISYISLHNVADFAVESLSNPVAKNAVLELGGPEALSLVEVVQLFEEITWRTFEKQFVPEEALEARKAAAGNPVEQALADLALAAAAGDAIDMSQTFAKFSVRPKSVREYAKSIVN